MDANPDDEEVAPDDPPDRISYLLPEGCSDIVDAWNLEKELQERGEVKKVVALPPSLTMRELMKKLAEAEGNEMEIFKALFHMKLDLEIDAVIDYHTAAKVCARLGIVPRPEGGA